jgi:4-hydroxy-3-polyprenylbenzoate decarboxylase
VTTGGVDGGTTTCGLLVWTGRATGLGAGGGCRRYFASGFVQFSADETGGADGLMASGGGCDGPVAQPARKISAQQNAIPESLNTRQLCGTGKATQAVSIFNLRFTVLDLRFRTLKILVAITGASGAIYAQRLLDNLNPREHEIHVVQSNYAAQVIAEELPGGLKLPDGVKSHSLKSMNAPFASGSNPPDAMVVIPCTMGTMGRIAHGYSEDVLLRAADVTLKERRKLILVPRETPLSLVHVKNMELLLLTGAMILPANPSFYSGAKTVEQIADTVVARVLDHLGIKNELAPRWAEEKE